MRILHIGKYFPDHKGGMEVFYGDLLPALRARNIETALLAHCHNDSDVDDDYNFIPAACYGEFMHVPISPTFPLALNQAIKVFGPDILHMHLPNASALWALTLPAARHLPWVVHYHADAMVTGESMLTVAFWLYRRIENILLGKSSAIIATSKAYAESSAVLMPWQEKVTAIPLGVDTNRLGKPDESMARWADTIWKPKLRRILSVGRLAYYKGFDTLIEAVAQSDSLQAVIVGAGQEENRLRTLINRLGLSRKVTLLGEVKDPYRNGLLASCDIFCMPSLDRAEAFGLSLLEAMHYAKPLVASDIAGSGLLTLVDPGKTGLLVPPGDATALAHALDSIYDDIALRWGGEGRQRLFERYTIDQVADSMAPIYERVMP